MIDEMFFRFLSHWYDREQARAQYLQQMPKYAALLKKQDRASWALDASLDSGGREAFLENMRRRTTPSRAWRRRRPSSPA